MSTSRDATLSESKTSDNKENDVAKCLSVPVSSFYGRVSDGRCYPIFRRRNERWSDRCKENFDSLLKKPLGKSKIATTRGLDKTKKRRDRNKKLEQMILVEFYS